MMWPTRYSRIHPHTGLAVPSGKHSFQAASPLETHFRKATCAESECRAYQNGWKTTVDTSTDLGKLQHDYIKYQSGRRFDVSHSPDGVLVTFTFYPGQTCFASDAHPPRRNDRGSIFAIGGRVAEVPRWLDELHKLTDRNISEV